MGLDKATLEELSVSKRERMPRDRVVVACSLSEMAPPATRTDRFTTTHWSVVLAARRSGFPEAGEALEKLCCSYWYPLYAYVRRRGASPADAQDLIQGFFARLLEKNYLQDVDPQKGRFRSFLLAALNHFLLDETKKQRAEKRGGTRTIISLDEEAAGKRFEQEASSRLTLEQSFDRNWALAVMDQALTRLREELRSAGRAAEGERLLVFLSGTPSEQDYATLGSALGISRGAVAARVHRLRQRYRERVREEIAQTVTGEDQLREEMRYLFSILSA